MIIHLQSKKQKVEAALTALSDRPSLNSYSFSENFFIFLFVSFSEGMECIAYVCV